MSLRISEAKSRSNYPHRKYLFWLWCRISGMTDRIFLLSTQRYRTLTQRLDKPIGGTIFARSWQERASCEIACETCDPSRFYETIKPTDRAFEMERGLRCVYEVWAIKSRDGINANVHYARWQMSLFFEPFGYLRFQSHEVVLYCEWWS